MTLGLKMSNENNSYKYLCFSGVDFTNFVSFVKSMNIKDKSKCTKNILLHVENDKLVCRAVDDSSNYIEYYVDLINDIPYDIITDYIVASIGDLATLIKCSNGSRFVIRKLHNNCEFNVIGNGWLPFKILDVDKDKFIVNGVPDECGTVNSIKLRNAISAVLGYTQEYTHARDKYIQFTKSQMVVTSRLSSVVMFDEFIDMTLHRDDAAMLRSLLKDNFDLTVNKITSSVDRLMFVGPKFKLSTIAVGIDPANVNYIDDIKDYVTVDCDELYKIVTVAEEYSASKRIVGLSIKNGKLQTNVKNNLAARHISTMESNAIGNVEDTTKEVRDTVDEIVITSKGMWDNIISLPKTVSLMCSTAALPQTIPTTGGIPNPITVVLDVMNIIDSILALFPPIIQDMLKILTLCKKLMIPLDKIPFLSKVIDIIIKI